MYEINEYVMYGNVGVCKVEDITTQDFGPKGLCYTLQPIYSKGSKIYISVENAIVCMRRIITKDEANRLMKDVSEIELSNNSNEKAQEAEYREMLRSGDCLQWISILKSLYMKKQKRIQSGKKLSQTDEKMVQMAAKLLYGELAESLSTPVEKVAEHLEELFQKEVVEN